MSKIVFDALRANPEGLDVDQLAAIVLEQEGFDPQDQETASTVRQRCMMAIYRYYNRGRIVKERRGTIRVWKLLSMESARS
jgi:hypothetical protein